MKSGSDTSMSWKTLNSKLVFDTKWFKVRQDTVEMPNGKIFDDYFISELPPVAIVFALTQDNQIIMKKEFRQGVGQVLLELPAGTYKKGQETPHDAAVREFTEETGYKAKEMTHLGTFYEYPTKDSHQVDAYIASGVEYVGTDFVEDTEDIKLVLVPLDQVKKMISTGEIQVSGSVATIFMALEKLQNTA